MLKWEQSITRIRREPLERFNESIQTPDYFRDRRVNFSHIAGSDRFFKTLLIVLLTGLGAALGYYLQQTNLLDEYFKQNNH